MVLQTLGKLATKAVKVANNKAESLLNKGIEKLDALEQKKAAPKASAGAKRARVKVTLSAEIGNNTNLVVLLTKGDRTERITFTKNGEAHTEVLNAIVKAVKETGAL